MDSQVGAQCHDQMVGDFADIYVLGHDLCPSSLCGDATIAEAGGASSVPGGGPDPHTQPPPDTS